MAKNNENGRIFKDVALEWLESKKDAVKKASYAQYEYTLKSAVLPYVGKKRMKTVGGEAFLKELESKLIEEGYSEKTILNIFVLIKSVIRYGQGLPFQYEPEEKKSKHSDASISEAKRIVAEAKAGKLDYRKLGIIIIMYTGVSVSELCGLRWNCIDMKNLYITVNQRIARVSNGEGTELVSEDVDVRRAPINGQFKKIINMYMNAVESGNYVLTNSEKCMEPRTFQMYVKQFFKKAGFKKVRTPSEMREMFIISSLKNGVSFVAMAKITGVTVQRILDIYADFICEPDVHQEMSKLVY